MDFLKFELPEVETMDGEVGGPFLVIAKKDDLRLGLAVILTPFKVKESVWVSIGIQLRVAGIRSVITPATAIIAFGEFPFYQTKQYSEALGVTPLVAIPCSPAEVVTHYDSFKGELETNIIVQIKQKFRPVNCSLILSENLLIEYIRVRLMDLIPTVFVTTNGTAKLLWISPNEADRSSAAE